jgi:hypothetical protein
MEYKYLKTHPKSTWNNSPGKTPTKYIGFVYEVIERPTGFKYIGIKRFWEKKALPALKGNKNKRRFLQESEWRTYTTSGVMKSYIERNPTDYYKTIIRNCETLTELKAYEAYLVLKDHFEQGHSLVNEMVQLRIRLRK